MTNIYSALLKLRIRNAVPVLLLFALLLSFSAAATEGCQMVPLPLEQRIKESEIIVEGEVLSQKAFWDDRHENIYTSHTIKVFKVFKGQVRDEQIEVITEGGAIGLKKHVYSSALQLYRGQQGILFLNPEKQLKSPGKGLATRAYGSQQGFVTYDLEQSAAADVFNTYSSVREVYKSITDRTGANYRTLSKNKRLEDFAIDQTKQQQQQPAAVPVITNFSPVVTSAGTGVVLTINGTNFGSTRGAGRVEFRNSDDGGKTFIQPVERDYVSWTNNQIRVRIPSQGKDGGTAGSGEIRVVNNEGSSIQSLGKLTIEYAWSNVTLAKRAFQPVLSNMDRNGGYTIQFAPSMQSRAAAQEGFRRAMNSWVCKTGVNWQIGAGTTIEASSDENADINVIRFAPGSVTGAGVLARTVSRYDGCRIGSGTTADTLFWLSEFDMEVNSNINWQYGPGAPSPQQFDYETVVLHELGHAHQLGHVILPNVAIMHYAIESERIIRGISSADIEGATLIMEKSVVPIQNACGREPMVREEEGDCNLPPEIYTLDVSFASSDAVKINWQTNNERTVDFFVVQRREEGSEEWTDVGEVNAKGPASGLLSYTFTDPSPLPCIGFYRLKFVYSDGSSRTTYSSRVINSACVGQLRVYPNPINPDDNTITLNYIVRANTQMTLQFYDASGKLFKDLEVTFSDALVPVEVDVSELAGGMYIMRWSDATNSGQIKIVKLRH
ncbi:IPT/TIG domain-containing protein [Pontibacter ruber]|uniref:IPT/TIG domain-containing protein n=1 Tax=Pontibacter ruber TaxID=1343895 RepID=A0ABW5D0R3_9BACT|nr:IPT/TIG domain-containing protein [Pontibacter ruber]